MRANQGKGRLSQTVQQGSAVPYQQETYKSRLTKKAKETSFPSQAFQLFLCHFGPLPQPLSLPVALAPKACVSLELAPCLRHVHQEIGPGEGRRTALQLPWSRIRCQVRLPCPHRNKPMLFGGQIKPAIEAPRKEYSP